MTRQCFIRLFWLFVGAFDIKESKIALTLVLMQTVFWTFNQKPIKNGEVKLKWHNKSFEGFKDLFPQQYAFLVVETVMGMFSFHGKACTSI